MAKLQVELVSVERELWTGEADMVIVKTTEGDLGVLPGHAPVLAQLADGGVVRVIEDKAETRIAAHGGFVSVTKQGVAILAETAELADDIDVARARRALERSGERRRGRAGRPAARRDAVARRRRPGLTGPDWDDGDRRTSPCRR